ncbi:hypothetical protein BJN34_12725 [Cupriavidus necator]|uniref:Uncharacterized protein n=1 Tax=Cupriavidus necator TaxID=106590 RepID=A0A1U9UPV3_CUPNE|nr:hypothetical protein [Cupriavidus necator]AQV94744.1 hypothetical protein BJN34_12725 [Cupriavidus necator]
MSLIFMDGFDHYATADITKKWTSLAGASINASGGRRGGGAMSVSGSGNYVQKTFPAAAGWVVGAALSANILSSATIFALLDAGTIQCDLRLNVDGTLSVTRNGTAVTGGTSTLALSAGTFYYIEWKVTIADSIGANSCKVRVNGVDWITVATGQDLKSTANATANQVRLGISASTLTLLYDDHYVNDQNGSVNNDFLGDVRVDALYPTSDGANQAWTPSTAGAHWSLVDETAPNTTDYVESGTAAQKDTYGMGDISHTPVSIFGTQVNIAALKDDAGARSLKPVTRSGGTDYSGTAQALATTQAYYSEVRETDPATSAAWTKTGFNAAEFGVECV